MADINLTASMRSNLLSLQNTQDLMDMTSERLSTGKKVNSAIDNPSSYYTASSLENRAGDLSSLMDSMGQGISTLKATDEAIMSITDFVEQAKAIVAGAAELPLDAAENREGLIPAADITTALTAANGADAVKAELEVIVDGRALRVEIEKTGGTPAAPLATAADVEESLQDALGDAFMVKTATAADVTAGLADAAGDFMIEYTGSSTVNVESVGVVTTDVDGVETGPVQLADGTDELFEAGADYSNFSAEFTGRADALARYNDIMIQIDSMAKDASYKGVNLLDGRGGELTVYFNEDRSSALKIDGVDATSFGLLLSDDLTTTEVEGVNDLSTNELINASLTTIDNAIETLRSYASEFGDNYAVVQNREAFTESMINVLTEGSDKLVLADMNEEGANMLALQTRQQLATNSLSLASQAAQSVLSLFG